MFNQGASSGRTRVQRLPRSWSRAADGLRSGAQWASAVRLVEMSGALSAGAASAPTPGVGCGLPRVGLSTLYYFRADVVGVSPTLVMADGPAVGMT